MANFFDLNHIIVQRKITSSIRHLSFTLLWVINEKSER